MDSTYELTELAAGRFEARTNDRATQRLLEEANLPEKPLVRQVPTTCSETDLQIDFCQPFRFAAQETMKIDRVEQDLRIDTGDDFSQEGTRQTLRLKEGYTIELDDSGTLTIKDKEGKRLSIEEIHQAPNRRNQRQYYSVGNGQMFGELDTQFGSRLVLELGRGDTVMITQHGLAVLFRETDRRGPRRYIFP